MSVVTFGGLGVRTSIVMSGDDWILPLDGARPMLWVLLEDAAATA